MWENRELIPDLPLSFMRNSLLIGFLVMICLSNRELQNLSVPHHKIMDFVSYYFDTVMLQGFSILIVAWVISRFLSCKGMSRGAMSFVWALAILGCMMGFELILERIVLKPSFSYDRFEQSVETAMVAFLNQGGHFGGEEKTACPSGFALRQVILFLTFLLIHRQEEWHRLFEKRVSRALQKTLYPINVGLLFLVPFLRVYWGRHHFFDIGMSIGIGVFTFWSITLLVSNWLRGSMEDFQCLVFMAVPMAAFTFVIFLYTEGPARWLIFCWLLIMVSGLTYRRRCRTYESLMGGPE